MPVFIITLPDGSTNTIIATQEAVEAVYPGAWEYVCEEPTPAPVVPQSITRRQGLLALYAARGVKEENIQEVIKTIPDEAQQYCAQVEFSGATWERGSEAIALFAQVLGLSDADVDELFTFAKTL